MFVIINHHSSIMTISDDRNKFFSRQSVAFYKYKGGRKSDDDGSANRLLKASLLMPSSFSGFFNTFLVFEVHLVGRHPRTYPRNVTSRARNSRISVSSFINDAGGATTRARRGRRMRPKTRPTLERAARRSRIFFPRLIVAIRDVS